MKTTALIFAVATITCASAALAYEDEMMGTMVNGRMTVRDERSDRVRDPEMDREEMIIDREKRQGRSSTNAKDDGISGERQPYEGPLPD